MTPSRWAIWDQEYCELDGTTVAVYAFDVAGGKIKHIWAVLNPDKLQPWTARRGGPTHGPR